MIREQTFTAEDAEDAEEFSIMAQTGDASAFSADSAVHNRLHGLPSVHESQKAIWAPFNPYNRLI